MLKVGFYPRSILMKSHGKACHLIPEQKVQTTQPFVKVCQSLHLTLHIRFAKYNFIPELLITKSPLKQFPTNLILMKVQRGY